MTPELLAPAGGPEQLRAALHFGADAVYLAGERWGMRARARNFTRDELASAVAYAHASGARVHVTLNTVMTDADTDVLPDYLHFISDIGVDAAIVADLGVLMLLREHAPGVEPHLSTQASVMSAAAVRAWAQLGVRRVVLARELSLARIAELRRRLGSEPQLEVFVHGSMCVAYSGRCSLSAELTDGARSSANGACAQPCRWSWEIVEERLPERPLPAEADGRGTYLLSSNDLCMLEHLDELREAGIDSLKIEGRNKGTYYVASVVNAYRHVLDGEPAERWMGELEATSHRPFSTGFFFGEPGESQAAYTRERTMVGVVAEGGAAASGVLVEGRNSARAGDVLQVLSPGHEVREYVLERDIRNQESYELNPPFEVAAGDILCR